MIQFFVKTFVGFLFLSCSPSEIPSGISCRGFVWEMPAFHSFGTRTNERFKNNPVNWSQEAFAISSQSEKEIAFTARMRFQTLPGLPQNVMSATERRQCFVFPSRPDTPILASAITWKTRNVPILNRIGIRHDHCLQHGCVQSVQRITSPLAARILQESRS